MSVTIHRIIIINDSFKFLKTEQTCNYFKRFLKKISDYFDSNSRGKNSEGILASFQQFESQECFELNKNTYT